MNLLIKSMTIVLSLIAGSQAMEVEMKKNPFDALPEKDLKIMILAEAAPYYCYEDGHAGELASVCKDWKRLIDLPLFNHPFYKTPVNMEHYCLFNIFKTLKLIYRPDDDNNHGMKKLFLSDLVNSSGEFDPFNIKEFENADQYLRITPGYKKVIPEKKEDILEIWIVLRFDIEKELAEGKAKHFEDIFKNWKKNAPVGIFWTRGGWDNIKWMDYLITENFKSLSNKNIYDMWGMRGDRRSLPRHQPYVRDCITGEQTPYYDEHISLIFHSRVCVNQNKTY